MEEATSTIMTHPLNSVSVVTPIFNFQIFQEGRLWNMNWINSSFHLNLHFYHQLTRPAYFLTIKMNTHNFCQRCLTQKLFILCRMSNFQTDGICFQFKVLTWINKSIVTLLERTIVWLAHKITWNTENYPKCENIVIFITKKKTNAQFW